MPPAATKRDKLRTGKVMVSSDIDAHRNELRIAEDNPQIRRELFPAADRLRAPKQTPACKDAIYELTQKHLVTATLWWKDMEARGLVEPDGARGWKRTHRWKAEHFDHQVPTYCHIKKMKRGYRKAIEAGYRDQWTCWADVKAASRSIYDKMYKLSPMFFTIRHLYALSKAESDPKPARTKTRHPTFPSPTTPGSRTLTRTRSAAAIPNRESPSSDSELSDVESTWSDVDEESSSEAEIPLQRRKSDRIRLNAQYIARTRAGGRRTRASGKQPTDGGVRTRSGRQRERKVEAADAEWETDLEEVEDEAEEEAEEADDEEEGSVMWSPSAERGAAEDVGVTTRSGKKRSAKSETRESEAESEMEVSPRPLKRPRRASSGARSRGRVGAVDRNMEENVRQLELQEREAAKARSRAVRGCQRGASTNRGGTHAWVERGRILSPEVKEEDGESEREEVVIVESNSAKRPRPRSDYGGPSLRVEIPAMRGQRAAVPNTKPVEVEVSSQPAKKPRVLPKIARYAPTPPMTSASSSTPSLTRSERDSSGSDSPLTPLPLSLPGLPTTSTSPQVRPSAIDLSFTACVRASKAAHADESTSRSEYAEPYSAPTRQNETIPTTEHGCSASTGSSAVREAHPLTTLSIHAINWSDPANNDAFLNMLYTDIYTRSTLIPSLHPLPAGTPIREPAKVERDIYDKLMMLEPGHIWLEKAHSARWAGKPTKGRSAGMWKAAAGWPLVGLEYGFSDRVDELFGAWKRGTFDLDYAGQFGPSPASPTLTEKMTFLFGAPGLLFSPTPSPVPSPKSPVSPLPLRESLPLPPPLSNTSPPVADLIDIGAYDDGSLVTEPLAGLVRRYAGWRSLPQKPVQLYPLTDAEERRLIDRYLQLDYRWRPKEEYLAKIQLAYTLEFWASRFAPSFESSLNFLGGMALLSFDSAKSIAETLLDGVIGSIAATPNVDLGGGKRRTFHRLAFSMETIGDVPLYNRLADLVYVTGARHLDQHQIRAADKFHNDLRFELHLRRSLSPNMPKVQVDGDCVHQISLFDYLIFVAQTYKLL